MTTTSSVAENTRAGSAMPPIGNLPYKTVAIYPDFSNVGAALAVLKKNGFNENQISLLGREQEHWQENLNLEWEAIKTAKGTLEGAALGSIPGLILIAGIALTGGAGLLVAGPMAAAMAGLGAGALGGGLLGAVGSNIDSEQMPVDVNTQVEDAIGLGQWVIVAHSHDHTEAMLAQKLLHNARIVHANEITDKI